MPNDKKPTASSEQTDAKSKATSGELKTAPELSKELHEQVKKYEVSNGKKISSSSLHKDVSTSHPQDEDPVPAANIDDPLSDAAIDEIAANEGDELLAIEDEDNATRAANVSKPDSRGKLRRLFSHKLTWIIVVLVLLAALFAVPVTRYKLLGLVIKKTYAVEVTDSKTDTPVSDVSVSLDGKTVKTDGAGEAKITVPVGSHRLIITKQYYQSYNQSVTVGLTHKTSPLAVHLVATGRQVPLMVSDKISGKPLSNATITILNTTAKTNAEGKATIVLPTKQQTYTATITASGYNSAQATVTVSSALIASNQFDLTPAGKVYFLSNATGTVNVVSTNLDGSDQQTVLAGTGNESPYTTQLYNSSDWKYLMLSAQRSSTANNPGLYLINTASNNAVTTVDQGNDSFTPIGWAGHYFVYEVQNLGLNGNEAGQYILKSYDADTGHLQTLDQSEATGTSSDYADQTFGNFYLFNNDLLYTKLWQGDNTYYNSSSFVSSINTINVDGQSQAPLHQFSMNANPFVTSLPSTMYGNNELYYEANFSDGSNQFYSYSNGSLSSVSLTPSQFNSINYTPGVASPSGNTAVFGAIRNGQFVLLGGALDSSASSQHTLTSLSNNYIFYGWYTDNYILLSYKNNTLYIMPASGLSGNQQPLKIANYLGQL